MACGLSGAAEKCGQPSSEGSFSPSRYRKEGLPMVTYTDLIQIGILIVGIVGLFLQAKKK